MNIEAGHRLWNISTSWGVGMWAEAEEAWLRGARLIVGVDPNVPIEGTSARERVLRELSVRRVVRPNPYRGMIEGDEYLVSRWVGAGTKGTVYKVFGLPVALKIFDGGITRFRDMEVHFSSPDAVTDVYGYMLREVEVLRGVDEAGLGAARVIKVLDSGFLRELVDGITLGALETILDIDDIRPAYEALDEYRYLLHEAGFTDYDGDLTGNIVYTRNHRWVMIDY